MNENIKFSWSLVRSPLVITTVVAVLILDQLTKFLIIWNLPLYQNIPLLPFLEITHVKNKGAAFGIFHDLPDSIRLVFFGVVTIICVALLVQWLGKTPLNQKWMRFYLALTIGGAFGNAIDRFAFGEVTDFIHVYWKDVWSYPSFNVADSAISVGITMILFSVFILPMIKKNKPAAAA